MKNRILRALLATVVLAVPVASFAQTSGVITRAQVEAQLSQLEHAGYSPSANSNAYPADIQAAETKVSMSEAQAANTPVMNSEGGMPMQGHFAAGQGCVGPVDFCTPYFGS